MARFRSIEPTLWDNGELRRLGMVPRLVFLFLFSKWADDEGRFKMDLFGIVEGAFSRVDPITEDDVAEALAGLEEQGMILVYGEEREYGWLTGWYCHQSIDKRFRDESNLLPPPTLVSSWEDAEQARILYAETLGLSDPGRCSFRDAVRWHTEQVRGKNTSITREEREQYALEGKGREGKGSKGLLQNSDELPPPKKPKSGHGKRQKRSAEDLQTDINALREGRTPALLAALDEYLDVCAGENKGGAITKGRELTETKALLAAVEKDELTDEQLTYGVAAAARKGAGNVNYVRAAAKDGAAVGAKQPEGAGTEALSFADREFIRQYGGIGPEHVAQFREDFKRNFPDELPDEEGDADGDGNS